MILHCRTREDVVLPLSKPVRGVDGSLITHIPLSKHTPVFVGLISSNTSTDIWGPDANEWKPERWLSPLPDTVTESKVPGIYSNLYVLRIIHPGCTMLTLVGVAG